MEENKQQTLQEVENFNKGKLKKTTTNEKPYIPTQKDIDDEKRAQKEGNTN